MVSVIFKAHRGENHYINCAFPNNLTSQGQVQALKKLQNSTNTAEVSYWEKVTDAVTGRIVGAAIWAIFTTHKPENATPPIMDGLKVPRNVQYVKELDSSIARVEAKFWRDNTLPLTSQSLRRRHDHAIEKFKLISSRSLCPCCSTRVPTHGDRHIAHEIGV